MQLHNRVQAAPVLTRRDVKNKPIFMQNHAAYACMIIFMNVCRDDSLPPHMMRIILNNTGSCGMWKKPATYLSTTSYCLLKSYECT